MIQVAIVVATRGVWFKHRDAGFYPAWVQGTVRLLLRIASFLGFQSTGSVRTAAILLIDQTPPGAHLPAAGSPIGVDRGFA